MNGFGLLYSFFFVVLEVDMIGLAGESYIDVEYKENNWQVTTTQDLEKLELIERVRLLENKLEIETRHNMKLFHDLCTALRRDQNAKL